MTNYSVCDFCHKAHPEKDIENVVVTYKKCNSCTVEITVGAVTAKVEPSLTELYPMLDPSRMNLDNVPTVPVQPMAPAQPIMLPNGRPIPPFDPSKPAANPMDRPPREVASVFTQPGMERE